MPNILLRDLVHVEFDGENVHELGITYCKNTYTMGMFLHYNNTLARITESKPTCLYCVALFGRIR